MAKLNQIIAIEKGIKARVYGEVTTLHKAVQHPELFNGFTKEFEPIEDGDTLPPEGKRVQYVVDDALRAVERGSTELFSVTARKDWSNCVAKADVKIGDTVIVPQAPVSFLLFLEKQLVDLRTFIASLPVLDAADSWSKDVNSGLFKTAGARTTRTKKVAKPIVLYNATPEHPAQTQMVTEDILAGYWTAVKMSGAMPNPRKAIIARRVEMLIQAVKTAREEANMIEEAKTPPIGGAVYGYLFDEGDDV